MALKLNVHILFLMIGIRSSSEREDGHSSTSEKSVFFPVN